MNKPAIISIAVLAALGGAFFVFLPANQPRTPVPEVAPAPPAAVEAPVIRYPLAEAPPAAETPAEIMPPAEETPPPMPLPGIEEADTAMRQLLGQLGDRENLAELFLLDHFIQRFVVTVDNLPSKELPRKQLPVKSAAGQFMIRQTDAGQSIHPDNYQRYTPYVELAEALDNRRLVDLYVRLYPLFQQAYVDLGQPSGYFNDRLVAVIDHLLETPPPPESILLEQPLVRYRFADPALESRSAGRKILLRVGVDNATRIKTKLTALRAELMTRTVEEPARQKDEKIKR